MFNTIKIGINFFIVILLSCLSFFVSSQAEKQKPFVDILNKANNHNQQRSYYLEENNQKNIDEMGFLLYDFLRKKELKKIDAIINEYIRYQQHDKNLVRFIFAEKEIINRNYDKAILYYQEILRDKPNTLAVELKLARILFDIKRDQDALSVYQGIRLSYKNKLPIRIKEFVNQQITYLQNKNSWQGVIKLGSSYNLNLNEASNKNKQHCAYRICMGSGSKPIAGGKWQYSVDLSKRYPIYQQHAGKWLLSGSGIEPMKDITSRRNSLFIGAGYQFEDDVKKVELFPVFKTHWCDNQFRHASVGIKSAIDYSLDEQVSLSGYLSVDKNYHIANYDFNDGLEVSYFLMGRHIITPSTVLSLSFHGVNRDKKLPSDSYQQQGIKADILNYYDLFELLISTGYKNTQFKSFDRSINVKREDHNWYLNTQLSLRNKSIFKFTPSIYFNNQLNKSTADVIYSFKQSEVGVNFIKRF
ncbi:porin family protein [Providencia rettgeri]|uniref:porin family protein n=1 Tax=Providencia rettgeri TaxID=587 RepID=UPI0023AA4ED4|nr:porin family protein [Providencia rettgeri]